MFDFATTDPVHAAIPDMQTKERFAERQQIKRRSSSGQLIPLHRSSERGIGGPKKGEKFPLIRDYRPSKCARYAAKHNLGRLSSPPTTIEYGQGVLRFGHPDPILVVGTVCASIRLSDELHVLIARAAQRISAQLRQPARDRVANYDSRGAGWRQLQRAELDAKR